MAAAGPGQPTKRRSNGRVGSPTPPRVTRRRPNADPITRRLTQGSGPDWTGDTPSSAATCARACVPGPAPALRNTTPARMRARRLGRGWAIARSRDPADAGPCGALHTVRMVGLGRGQATASL